MIYILIPVFNRKNFTQKCIESLKKQTYKDFTIIVIDDGSSDGTSEFLTNEYPEVILLKGDGNLWWAGATNAGLEYVLSVKNISENDFILTLNNDLEVPCNYLENLFEATLTHKRSIIGSASVDIQNPDYLIFCGIRWNEFTAKYFSKARTYKNSFKIFKLNANYIESDMLPGRGTLIPVQVFKEIGLFDAHDFPQYAADEDFTLRAKKKGWRLIVPSNVFLLSHLTTTGVQLQDVQYDIRKLKELFFSIRSPLNLKIMYRFAIKNTRLKFVYFLFNFARISFSLLRISLNKNVKSSDI